MVGRRIASVSSLRPLNARKKREDSNPTSQSTSKPYPAASREKDSRSAKKRPLMRESASTWSLAHTAALKEKQSAAAGGKGPMEA